MNDPEVQARKVGRPATRAAVRGRSNSLGGSPNLQRRLSAAQLLNLPVVAPIVDEILGGLPLDPNPHVANDPIPPAINPIPPVNAAPIPELDPEIPAAEQAPPYIPLPPPPIPPAPENLGPTPEQLLNMRLRGEAVAIVAESQEFIEVNEGMEMNSPLLAYIKEEDTRLVLAINALLNQILDNPDLTDVHAELVRWRRILKTFLTSMMGKFRVPQATPAPQPAPQSTRPDPSPMQRQSTSPGNARMIHRDLVFFVSKLHDDLMPDVSNGADISNSELRNLHDVTLPQINRSIDDCRRVLKSYTSLAEFDEDLAETAQQRCEDATIWASDLTFRYHSQQLHLDKNTKHREITFSPFKPGGDVSIYQFLINFETWADGYLSKEAKADQLYNKYLDKTITETYTEITVLREDFAGMKQWLVKKYGSVVPIAHGCIKSILKLKIPSKSDHSASVHYLRSAHRLLVNLSELEICKGKPVPKLQSYLGSNAFLSALVEAFPPHIKGKLFDDLLDEGIDDINTIEGKHHLTSIMHILKKMFMRHELMINTTPISAQLAPNQKSAKTGKPSSSNQQTANVTTASQTPLPTNNQLPSNPPTKKNQNSILPTVPQNPPPINILPPFLTGGNTTPLNNWQPAQQYQNNQNQGQASGNRWSCPMKDHGGHHIAECAEFWSLNPRDRRTACKFSGCYTCLERNRTCRSGACVRYHEVPAELICPDCAQMVSPGKAPVCVAFCGMMGHKKPQLQELTRAFEAWIPHLNLRTLGAQIRVNLTSLGIHSTSIMPPPPCSKTGPPTPNLSNMVYDTTTGDPRPLTNKDHVNRTSMEVAFYAMQTVRIRNQDVLMFYDSGSNSHLIEGTLAEQLRLDVLASECVPVGALGGKTSWSEFGAYTVTLGPDMNGECHELEMQGIPSITSVIPEVDLQELWDGAKSVLPRGTQLPAKIGGTNAQILVGIKSTRLGPKLIHTLPNGLGIYESVIYDVFQSNICFGGPHAVFTQAYRKVGMSTNHVQVMFTEMARAYMDSPKTFIRVNVEEHGPPLDIARELDLVEEISNAFPLYSKTIQTSPVDTSFCHNKLHMEVDETEDGDRGCLNNFEEAATDTTLLPISGEETGVKNWGDFNNMLDHCEHVNCMKSAIPLSKLKGLQDEMDIPEIVEFKCDSCANCPTCKLSARVKTKSLQESFEQQVIEKSVHVDMVEAKVWVDLPFIKEPVEYLTKKHSGPSNYNQALKVYQGQCRKRDEVKDQVRKAHGELVDKSYMSQLSDLPKELQDVVNSAPFHHYYPWRAVYKEDSVTTPVRLVVDPTMTGLNEILAKGVNMLSKIPELLIRFRCFRRTWNTDISKLYNQLHLNSGSLAFSLFLFHHDLDLNTPPSVWVMSRAWYGVSCTGNQAGVAIERLAHQFKDVHPAAYAVLISSRYVDDVLSGADSEEELEEQIRQTQECLKAGGFTMKYIARSGQKPPPKASVDGVHVGCLGLAWNTEEDTLSLGFNEDFFLKRLKGQKPPPIVNLKDSLALNEALTNNLITRAGILSRVAELYDPCGWWEPIKVQMKLAMQSLNGLNWTDPVPPDCRTEWVDLFHTMNQLKSIQIARSIMPEETVIVPKFRIIVVADAAAKSCGCAIYAGVEELDGKYSCSLILAKSKMVHGTIPRNELEGLVLSAEASLMVQRALLDSMDSIRFYTDSRIVVCWVLNQSKRLRMWAFNRVQAIHSMIKTQRDGEDFIPLYHINGLENIADLLTKVRAVRSSDLRITSEWHTGLKWMTLPSEELPCNQFTSIPEDLVEIYDQETFQEVKSFHADSPDEARLFLTSPPELDPDPLNPILESHVAACNLAPNTWFVFTFKFMELGWERARNRLRLVLKACHIFAHGRHELISVSGIRCYKCRGNPTFLMTEVDRLINQVASRQTELVFTKKKLEEKYHLKQDIWYSKSRLEKEGATEIQDLDCSPFFDHLHIKKFLPIVFVKLDIFRSYLMFIHMKEFPHMGIESTLRRIKGRFFPVGNVRAAIASVRGKCSKCRLMIQRTVALELAQFPAARTTVAPPFWSVQLDIAMSFKAKPTIKNRKTFPCHALIIVCLLTSATNILVMDGLTTQAVVQAIERHAARYGVPGHLYVDSGTQLEKLQDAHFQLRDVQMNIAAHRFQVTVAVPKAHKQQGRVEAKIKIMRKMLVAWSTSSEECNTLLGWETVFAKVACAIDDIPIARGSANAAYDLGWEIITPNRLKLGRNNYRQLEGPIRLDNCPQSQLERNQLLTSRWYELFIERLHLLVPPPAKEHDRQPVVGDVVLFLFTDPNFKKLWIWKLGVVEEAMSRSSYKIRYSGASGERKYVQRAVGQISIIVPSDQL